MVAEKSKILTAEQEAQLLAPIDEHVGAIQEKINALRVDGTDKVLDIQNSLENLKRDRIYTAEEKQKRAAELKKQLAPLNDKLDALQAENRMLRAELEKKNAPSEEQN
jgi:methyl-galactoside transport system permease protein